MIIVAERSNNLVKRYLANVIDYALLTIILASYGFIFGVQNESGGYTVTGFKVMAFPLIWFLYFPVCESLWKQTIGKKIFGLCVVDLRGESPTIAHAFLRRLLDPLEIIFLGAPAVLTISNSERKQRIGDMMAGTMVITTSAICRFCGAALELSTKEVANGVFKCPGCNEIN